MNQTKREPQRESLEGDELELEIKLLIVRATGLKGTRAEDIESHLPLFDEGLGLDSLDAIQIAIALDLSYGIKLGPDEDQIRSRFATVRSLADLVVERGRRGGRR